jgi:hypothetical protein
MGMVCRLYPGMMRALDAGTPQPAIAPTKRGRVYRLIR